MFWLDEELGAQVVLILVLGLVLLVVVVMEVVYQHVARCTWTG